MSHEIRTPDERRARHDRAAARHRPRPRSSASYAEQVHRSGDVAPVRHQRHPRLLQDRGGRARARDHRVRPAYGRRRGGRPARRAGPREGARARSPTSTPEVPAAVCGDAGRHPPGRCSTWSATRSSSPKRARWSSGCGSRSATGAPACLRVRGDRHRRSASRPRSRRGCSASFSQADASTTRLLRRHGPGPGDLASSWSS